MLVQRVASARVEVDGVVAGSIGAGMLVLAGFEAADSESDLIWVSSKLSKLRIFPDAAGVMNRSIVDSDGEIPVSYTHLDVYKRQGQLSLV